MQGCTLALKRVQREFARCSLQEVKEGRRNVSDANHESAAEVSKGRKSFTGVQGAPRFPIKLPVEMKSGAAGSPVETENISANGVLFRMDADVPVGSAVDFTISLPADVVGSNTDVQVDCRGRVVRSFENGGRRGVGVVIDEYRFERR